MLITAARIEDYEELVRVESIRWVQFKDAVEQLLNQLDTARDESIRDTGDRNTPEYDSLERKLGDVLDSITGRLQELEPAYSENQVYWMSDTAPLKEIMRYARHEGINYIALQGLSTAECKSAIEYISEHGLASMNYERACRAVSEYRAEALGLRKGC